MRLWPYVLNPCDTERHRSLVRLGDAMARLWEGFTAGTECPCCLGFRLLAVALAAFAFGVWVG